MSNDTRTGRDLDGLLTTSTDTGLTDAMRTEELRAAPRQGRALAALAGTEARRMLLSPVIWLGLALSVWWVLTTSPDHEPWPGEAYRTMAVCSSPFLLAVSVVTALSFHRERSGVATEAPVGEGRRMAARLLATVPLVGLAAGFAGFLGWRQEALGGMRLGYGPGRTDEALFSLGELGQHVALAVLAVALGAALGRRIPWLGASLPALLAVWFLASIYWLWGSLSTTAFSVIQAQPIHVPVGPPGLDPSTLPADWLLSAPDQYTPVWMRLFTSEALAWGHAVWLVGLALLLLAAAVPGRVARAALLSGGAVVAAAGAVAQLVVLP
jgi:hypothetical protein